MKSQELLQFVTHFPVSVLCQSDLLVSSQFYHLLLLGEFAKLLFQSLALFLCSLGM